VNVLIGYEVHQASNKGMAFVLDGGGQKYVLAPDLTMNGTAVFRFGNFPGRCDIKRRSY
jgi:hypothetical protein